MEGENKQIPNPQSNPEGQVEKYEKRPRGNFKKGGRGRGGYKKVSIFSINNLLFGLKYKDTKSYLRANKKLIDI